MTKALNAVYGAVKPTIPQGRPYIGKNQVQNNAGGYVFQIDPFKQLERFLILGTEGGTYYASEKQHTKLNADMVNACIALNGAKTLETIVSISEAGRAPKNDYALFALAACAAFGDVETRQRALDVLPRVARIGTHLFTFMTYLKGMRSQQAEGAPKMRWNRSLRTGIANWYKSKKADKLAYQMVKYQARKVEGVPGWSHRDLLRSTHPYGSVEQNALFDWATKGFKSQENLPELVSVYESLKSEKDAKVIVKAIQDHQLTREMIPTEALNSVEVWDALLQKMPLTALIRNLAKMTNVGLLKPGSKAANLVLEKLADQQYLLKSRVHPMQILTAMLTYKAGRGQRGKLVWTPLAPIVDALDDAFYASFPNAPQTGLRYYIGVDCSGSMGCGDVGGVSGFTPIMGAAAMAMVILHREPWSHVAGYSSGDGGRYHWGGASSGMKDLGFSRKMRLDTAIQRALAINWGGTDASLPYRDALAQKMDVDVFINITDSETWAGPQHAFAALNDYRQKRGINAYQIVIGMTATQFSVADPSDERSLDVVGFDTAVPQLIASFVGGPKLETSDEQETGGEE